MVGCFLLRLARVLKRRPAAAGKDGARAATCLRPPPLQNAAESAYLVGRFRPPRHLPLVEELETNRAQLVLRLFASTGILDRLPVLPRHAKLLLKFFLQLLRGPFSFSWQVISTAAANPA